MRRKMWRERRRFVNPHNFHRDTADLNLQTEEQEGEDEGAPQGQEGTARGVEGQTREEAEEEAEAESVWFFGNFICSYEPSTIHSDFGLFVFHLHLCFVVQSSTA